MTTLAALRSKLMEQNNKEQNTTNDNAIYPFWNIPQDSTAILRFLPDADESNDYFWVERNMIRLPFSGVIGGDTTKEVIVQVPCMEMWNEKCPILTQVRPWFKEADLEDLARKYWKKRTYIFQGIVRDDPLNSSDNPENPIRRFIINPSIYKIIHDTLMDPEMEDIPTDYVSGTDFRIVKTKQGEYASYSTSGYSRKTSSITDDEQAAINNYGLFNLSDFLPKKPDAAGVQILADMFEASVNGELYNPEKWAGHWKPYGLNYDSNATTTAPTVSPPKITETVAPVVTETVAPVVTETAVKTVTPVAPTTSTDSNKKKSPQDILARIKARKENA